MSLLRRRWLLDLGNSRLKCALADAQGHRGEILALGHESHDTAARLLAHLVAQPGSPGPNDEVWLASVAAAARTDALVSALTQSGFSVRPVRAAAAMGRLRIAYAKPAHLGVDRFLAMLAATQRDDGPWLVVSAGSALTIDLVGADGVHAGGLIAPMPATMRAALATRFEQLDVPTGKTEDFGTSTADAIASGCEGAAIALVERSLRRARSRLGMAPTLLVGGGGAALLADIDHAPTFVLPALVIDGLAAYVRAQPD